MRLFLTIVCCCCYTISSYSQQQGLSVDFISTEQGLPDKRVNCITQDNAGFMWLGTATGLYRYDGYSFQDFTWLITKPGQQKSTMINALEKDGQGNIWVGYADGLGIINPDNLTIKLQPLNGYAGTNTFVRTIMIDRQQRVLLYLDKGIVLCYNKDFKLIFQYRYSIRLMDVGFEHPIILQDTDNSYWLPTFVDGIDHIGFDGKFIAHYRTYLHDKKEQQQKTITDAKGLQYRFKISDPIYSIVQHKALTFLNAEYAALRASCTPSAFFDQKKNIWKIDLENITLIDTIVKKQIQFTLPYKGDFYSDNPIIRIYQSADNSIWTCSRKGIFKIHYKRTHFVNYLQKPYDPAKPGISIRGMAEDANGNIWIGSYPYIIEPTKRKTILSLIAPRQKTATPVLLKTDKEKPFDVGSSPLYKTIVLKNGEILASSEGSFMRYIDTYTGLVKSIASYKKQHDNLKALYKTNDSTVFFSTGDAVGIYHPYKKIFSDVYLNERNEQITGINNFFDAQQGKVWAVGDQGLYLLRHDGKLLRSFTGDKNSPIVLQALDIHFLYQQQTHIFWLGTRHGLVKLDTISKSSTVYTTNNGLPNNNVMSILPDEYDYLWLSTDNGLSRFNLQQQLFINYDINDELPHNEFNRMAYLKASDGCLYFGGLNGVTAIYPKDIDTSQGQLTPHFIGYSNYDGEKDAVVLHQTGSAITNRVIFNHHDKLFTFRFIFPSFRMPEKNRFQYMLQGWDKEWLTAGQTNTISYSYLPPGKYTLKVKGASGGDAWSNRYYTMQITVLQAWYKTWWFYTILLLMAIAAIYAGYRYRIQQIWKLQHIRNKISADLHDELGSVLTQISLQSELVNSNIISEAEKKQSLQDISNTSRKAIHTMSDIVWSVKAGQDIASSLTDRMKDHADLMLQHLPVQIHFSINGLGEKHEISSHLRQELFLIFKEAIHNIVKHSSPTMVEININNSRKQFEMMIKNDINVPPKNKVLGGSGFKNMERRAASVEAHLTTHIQDNCFTLSLKSSAI